MNALLLEQRHDISVLKNDVIRLNAVVSAQEAQIRALTQELQSVKAPTAEAPTPEVTQIECNLVAAVVTVPNFGICDTLEKIWQLGHGLLPGFEGLYLKDKDEEEVEGGASVETTKRWSTDPTSRVNLFQLRKIYGLINKVGGVLLLESALAHHKCFTFSNTGRIKMSRLAESVKVKDGKIQWVV